MHQLEKTTFTRRLLNILKLNIPTYDKLDSVLHFHI